MKQGEKQNGERNSIIFSAIIILLAVFMPNISNTFIEVMIKYFAMVIASVNIGSIIGIKM